MSDGYAELDLWREAGKDVGRRLGIAEERKRIRTILLERLEHYKNNLWVGEADAVVEILSLIEGEK